MLKKVTLLIFVISLSIGLSSGFFITKSHANTTPIIIDKNSLNFYAVANNIYVPTFYLEGSKYDGNNLKNEYLTYIWITYRSNNNNKLYYASVSTVKGIPCNSYIIPCPYEFLTVNINFEGLEWTKIFNQIYKENGLNPTTVYLDMFTDSLNLSLENEPLLVQVKEGSTKSYDLNDVIAILKILAGFELNNTNTMFLDITQNGRVELDDAIAIINNITSNPYRMTRNNTTLSNPEIIALFSSTMETICNPDKATNNDCTENITVEDIITKIQQNHPEIKISTI